MYFGTQEFPQICLPYLPAESLHFATDNPIYLVMFFPLILLLGFKFLTWINQFFTKQFILYLGWLYNEFHGIGLLLHHFLVTLRDPNIWYLRHLFPGLWNTEL